MCVSEFVCESVLSAPVSALCVVMFVSVVVVGGGGDGVCVVV